MTVTPLLLYLLTFPSPFLRLGGGQDRFHLSKSSTRHDDRSGSTSSSSALQAFSPYHQNPPSADAFPEGNDVLKVMYGCYVYNEEHEVYRGMDTFKVAEDRPKFMKLKADILELELNMWTFEDDEDHRIDAVHLVWDLESEYEPYEDWLEDMAHFKYVHQYYDCIQSFLEKPTTKKSQLKHRYNKFRNRYTKIYEKSKSRTSELLGDDFQQMALVPTPKAAGLRTITKMLSHAVTAVCSSDKCSHSDLAYLKSVVKFCMPLVETSLPSKFSPRVL